MEHDSRLRMIGGGSMTGLMTRVLAQPLSIACSFGVFHGREHVIHVNLQQLPESEVAKLLSHMLQYID